MVDVLSRYRVIEPSLKCKILNGEELIYICGRHFADEDIERTKIGKKTLRLEVAPTKNLPAKSKHCYQNLVNFAVEYNASN